MRWTLNILGKQRLFWILQYEGQVKMTNYKQKRSVPRSKCWRRRGAACSASYGSSPMLICSFCNFFIHPRTLRLSMVSIVRYTNPRFSFPLLLFISTRARGTRWFSERLDLIVSVGTSSGYQIFQWARSNEASQKLMVRYNSGLFNLKRDLGKTGETEPYQPELWTRIEIVNRNS